MKAGGGCLAITRLWPDMLRTITGDAEGRDLLVEVAQRRLLPGDGAKRGEAGYFWLFGRAAVAESAVVGITDELEGTRSQGS